MTIETTFPQFDSYACEGEHITVTIYGREYRALLLASHGCGTVDVQLPSGRCFRVSGLNVKG